jgi:glycosyltransferase involved in cell wall biosynthesis
MDAPPGAAAAPAISVVVPHLNQPGALGRCLAALGAQRDAPPFEILVVDNGSAALPEAVCAAAGARLLVEPEPGPGPARNRGAAAARAPLLAFIDADCIADPDWLATIAARFARDPEACVLGGDVRIACADPARPTLIEAYESVYGYRMDRYIREQGFTGTGNLAIRRAVFEAVGPFGGIDVAEDRDWGQRAGRMGHPTRYEPAMRVFHPARPDFAALAAKWDRQVAHDFARVPPGLRGRTLWLLRALVTAASPAAELPRILVSDRIAGGRARALAFAGLLRVRLYRAGRMVRLGLGADPATLSHAWNRPPSPPSPRP